MTKTVTFGCSILKGINKTGNLKRDSDGWFLDMVLGAFDVPNSVGDVYPLASAQQFFAPDSPLIRRASKGCLFGEADHPEWVKGMSKEEYFQRLNVVKFDNVSHGIRNLRLAVITNPQSGERITAVIADILPVREKGVHLEKELLTKDINVAFSLRSLTRDTPRMDLRYNKHISRLITYDWVNEGGIIHAQKYNSPSLEHFQDSMLLSGKNIHFMQDEVAGAFDKIAGVGNESAEIKEELGMIFADVPNTQGGIIIPAKKWFS